MNHVPTQQVALVMSATVGAVVCQRQAAVLLPAPLALKTALSKQAPPLHVIACWLWHLLVP
jgi:hypothetical protein